MEVKADIPVDSEDGKVGVGNQEGEVKWSTIWGILIGDCFHNFVGTVCKTISTVFFDVKVRLYNLFEFGFFSLGFSSLLNYAENLSRLSDTKKKMVLQ